MSARGVEPATTSAERADSRRARLRLIEATREAIAEQGLNVSGADIARRAEVGIGTLYRRFGSKEALIEAVVMDSVQQVSEAADRALGAADKAAAFEEFLRELCESLIANRGLTELATAVGANQSEAAQERFAYLRKVLKELTARAQDAGAVRSDVTWGDVAILAQATAMTSDCLGVSGDKSQWRRNFAVLMDGLAPHGRHDPPGRPPRVPRRLSHAESTR